MRRVHVALPLVSAEKADLGRDGFGDEAGESRRLGVCDDTGDDAPLAADSANDNALPSVGPPGPTPPPRLPLCRFLAFPPTNVSSTSTMPRELFEIAVGERRPDAMAHVPCRLVATEAEETINLQCAHSLFAGQHQVDDAKPILERLVRVFEDRSGECEKR